MLAWLATAVRFRNDKKASLLTENTTTKAITTPTGSMAPIPVPILILGQRVTSRIPCTATLRLQVYSALGAKHVSDEFPFAWLVLRRGVQNLGQTATPHHCDPVGQSNQFK